MWWTPSPGCVSRWSITPEARRGSLGCMAAQFFDLVDDLTVDPAKRDAIEQGAAFGWVVEFTADDVTGTTAADWLARMQVRRKLADLDVTDGTANTPLLDLDSDTVGGLTLTVADDTVRVEVAVDDGVTDGLPIGRFKYDLELERLADGYVRRVVEGKAQVRGEVTR